MSSYVSYCGNFVSMTKMPESINLEGFFPHVQFQRFYLGSVDLIAYVTFMPMVRQFIIVRGYRVKHSAYFIMAGKQKGKGNAVPESPSSICLY